MPQRLLICGTEGSCQFTGDDLTFVKTTKPYPEELAATTTASPGVEKRASDPLALSHAGHLANIRDFAEAVRDHRAPLVTAEEYRKVTRALNLIYNAAGVGPFAAMNINGEKSS
jgi:hypothetical protein